MNLNVDEQLYKEAKINVRKLIKNKKEASIKFVLMKK